MTLHRIPLRARAVRVGAAAVLALTLASGFAAPAVAAGSAAGPNASAQGQQDEKSAQATKNKKAKAAKNQSANSSKPRKNPTAAQASSTQGKPASPGQSAGKGKETAPGQVRSGGSATGNGNGNGVGKAASGTVGSENGTGADGSPPGNNGTVKIAPLGEMDGIPDNTPHPGCTFQVEWYGFDEGADIVSTVSFAMQAPTADVALSVDGPSEVFVGGSPARGAGNDGLDGVATYTLAFEGDPHPQQGYHVKLIVSTPRSNGNDTKTKVFWVAPCAPEAAAQATRTADAGVGDATTGSTTLAASGSDAAATGTTTEAQGGRSVPSTIAAGLRSAVAGSWLPLGVVALGAALLVAALALRLRSRGQLGA